MRVLRRISQAVFLTLFVYLFFQATYRLTSRIPVDLFLRADPLLAFSAAVTARTITVITIPALVMVAAAIVGGRFFCGWICPLGTVFDFAGRQGGRAARRRIRLTWLKYGLLIFIGATALASFQTAGFFDPMALFTRTATVVLYPLFVLLVEGGLSLLMHLPRLSLAVLKAGNAMKGTVLPLHELRFTAVIGVAVIGVALIAAIMVKRRFWCRYLCPLGALYALGARMRLYRRRVSDACTACGTCAAACRMEAISSDGRTTDHSECISCFDCVSVCPDNAVSFTFGKSAGRQAYDISRRRFITAGAAGIITAGLAGTALTRPRHRGTVIRPPGALPEHAFLDRCIRCGECVRGCSTSGGGLQFAGLQAGLEGVWTPLIVTESGYCELNCVMCGTVCPTGAIHPLDPEERLTIKMGTAYFNRNRCIPWYSGTACTVCEEHCPLPEKAILFSSGHGENRTGNGRAVLLPYVDESRCIGCGICVSKCPLEGERGIFLTSADETRWISD